MILLTNVIQFTTSPAGAAVGTRCDVDSDDDVIALTLGSGITAVTGEDDTWMVGAAGQIPAAAANLTIGVEACGDMAGFNDERVMFSFVADSLKGAPPGYGNVAAGANLVVTVRSVGEDKPEVSFSTTRLPITEGGTGTVAILADGTLGPEVGSVMVSVSGDAVLSLWQDGDPALDDGMTATATITIESANGADIGARNSLEVTVSGLTQETDPEPEPEDLVVTLSADPMEIEAGGTTTITATANRAVTADDDAVKIDLTVEGDGTLDAESITIAMGEMSGSVMLTANESVTVEATGSGISDPLQVMVTVAEAVPGLPLIAQWLLGLGLMDGGARQLFRRRRQG